MTQTRVWRQTDIEGRDRPARDEHIWRVFTTALDGQATTRETAVACHEHGVWTDDEWESLAIRGAMARVRSVLTAHDEHGIRRAGPSADTDPDSSQPIWKQRGLWQVEDYEINVREYQQQIDEMYWAALRLTKECEDRFGHRIEIQLPGVP